MLTYKIHLIRHGLTQGNLEGRYIGRTDMPLCDAGRKQLLELRESCEYPAVSKVYTSPLLRAKESAEILFPDRMVEVVDKLREFDFGDFEGKTMQDLENDSAFKEWVSGSAMASAPNGESGADFSGRAVEAIAYIFAQMMEQKMTSAAVVTHGGLIMNLLATMGLPQRDMIRWSVQNGRGYTILVTPQMWMRDQKFEVYEQIPYDNADDMPGGFDENENLYL